MSIVENNKSLGILIRSERKRQNLTQEELAALAGVGVRFLREAEHGKESCHIGLVLQLLQTLGLTLFVYGREDAPA